MRLLYRWRFTNWLMAKPWRWNLRTIYRTQREGFPPRDRQPTPAEANAIAIIEKRGWRHMYYEPAGLVTAAWRALTFPHVHTPEELEA